MDTRDEIEITRQMMEAGEFRLGELLQAGTSSAYVVSEVFQAMYAVMHRQAGLSRSHRDET